ncbi:MAG: efflux RND transporter periplasmic adaptor subunit [Bacteroidetes bacterium]|nr:MAG: efflux RND transporter periplasmic adaptor subunit [Bacteroidota bacterium]
MKYILSWILLGFTAISLLSACGGTEAAQNAPPPVPVNVFKVQVGSAVFYDEYPARVTALNQVDIRPQIAGYIDGIFFKDGQHVEKGQKLYSIDEQQYLGQYNQAVANLNVARANLAKAQQDANRYQELAKQDAIAGQILDHAMADLEANKKQVEAAEANVKSVHTNVRYSIISAPFAGTVGISQVKLGTAVVPGQTILNTISSDDPMAVDFAVDQKQIPRLEQLFHRTPPKNDSTFTIIRADQSKYPYPGKIFVIDRAVDPQTATIITRLVFPNKNGDLKVGMTCNVRIQNTTPSESILIPFKAVTEQMGEFFVFVVGDSNKVSQHKLTLGPRISNQTVVVRSGLEANQLIVVDGMQKLREGSKVQLPAPKAAGDSTKPMSGADTSKRK